MDFHPTNEHTDDADISSVQITYNWNWLISPKKLQEMKVTKKLWNWLGTIARRVTKSRKSIGKNNTNTKVEKD